MLIVIERGPEVLPQLRVKGRELRCLDLKPSKPQRLKHFYILKPLSSKPNTVFDVASVYFSTFFTGQPIEERPWAYETSPAIMPSPRKQLLALITSWQAGSSAIAGGAVPLPSRSRLRASGRGGSPRATFLRFLETVMDNTILVHMLPPIMEAPGA